LGKEVKVEILVAVFQAKQGVEKMRPHAGKEGFNGDFPAQARGRSDRRVAGRAGMETGRN